MAEHETKQILRKVFQYIGACAMWYCIRAEQYVITEHTMGLWKSQLPWLQYIRMRITNDPKSLETILHYIDATVVLHNMLIEFWIWKWWRWWWRYTMEYWWWTAQWHWWCNTHSQKGLLGLAFASWFFTWHKAWAVEKLYQWDLVLGCAKSWEQSGREWYRLNLCINLYLD